MKLSLPISILLSLLTLIMFPACSSDNESEEWIELTYSNLSVTTFSLNANDSVMAHLDSVFFSIDLDNARIFNADSLPKGTDIHSLSVSIGLPSVSRAMIYFDRANGRDSVDYIENSTDTIDFSHGPAILSITDPYGSISRNYTIQVNVHKEEPDSLSWGSTAMRTLPTSLAKPEKSRTSASDGTYYCLTSDGEKACIATTTNIQSNWIEHDAALPAGADINSFTASPDGLYILGAGGHLFKSTDTGASWTDTGTSMSHINGVFNNEIIGCYRRDTDGAYVQISYPSATDASTAAALPDGCPVEGTSPLLIFTTEWATEPTAITTGGRDASGKATGASWGYDGSKWLNLSIAPGLPRSGMNVILYTAHRTASYWTSTSYEVLLAFGGETAEGTISNEVWISFDRGLHWTQARETLQLPSHFPRLHNASTFVADQTLTDSALSGRSLTWTDFPAAPLPSRASIDTSWECPYIYILGGYNNADRLSSTIWRGAINRLTYRPLF